MPVNKETAAKFGEDGTALAQFWSRALRLQVFYALMYVVVEGYLELGYQDPAVDPLLAQSRFLDPFRRFRNPVFHYQGDLVSPKLQAFLDLPGSENWTYDLWRALKAFFEKQLTIREWFDSLPSRDQ